MLNSGFDHFAEALICAHGRAAAMHAAHRIGVPRKS
jgi:hypothetical protein